MVDVSAGMIIIKGPGGEMYQIDDNIKVEGEVRISRIRWPDNVVNIIHVGGCNGGLTVLTRFDQSGRRQYETLLWVSGGDNLIDRVAGAVCRG